MVPPDLLSAVETALSFASTIGYSNSSAANDVYEGYVLGLFCRAAKEENWDIKLCDPSGATVSQAVFRAGPGRLSSGNYTHVEVSREGKQTLEAHIGIRVAGKSPRRASRLISPTVLHEFDLLVLPSVSADIYRALDLDPCFLDAIVHAEAKYYGGNLPLPIGRASVGLSVECDLRNKSVLVTNQNGHSVQDLVEHHGIDFRFLITPSNSRGVYHLVQWFRRLLRSAP